MKKTVKIENPAGLPTIPWAELKAKFEPNALKQKKNRNVSRLKDSILSLGFIVPMFLWVKGKFITDGAGRFLALSMLEYEGYDIPPVPYVPIEAKNRKEAKRQTLVISSKYGSETNESLAEFTLDMKEIDLGMVNLDGFKMEEINWTPPKTQEIDMDNMGGNKKGKTKMRHECPECGHKFTTS